jgi:tight adherence protein C
VIAAALPWSWAVLAATVLMRLRPVPSRRLSRPEPQAPRVSDRLGVVVLRALGRDAASPALCRRVGLAVLAATVVLPVRPVAAVPAAAAAWALPGVRAGREARQRRAAIAAGVPEVVDLLVLATGAGLSVRHAVAAVAARADGPLAPVLQRVVDEAEHGRRLADALDDVPTRAGESVRPLIGALVASERYGAPIGPALERLAGEVRSDTRRRAEAAARRVPVKLLFPLVTCILPAFGLLTVAPLIASAVRSLRL